MGHAYRIFGGGLMAELLHRYCRTHACIYVETVVRNGQRAFCFQDFQGQRIYRTEAEIS